MIALRTDSPEAHMTFSNVYGDATRAAAYSRLEFDNTYYLAYRSIAPWVIWVLQPT